MCDKCNGTGLIPLVKEGKIIPNAWLDCDCKYQAPEPYRPLQPADIDFPISRDWYRYYASRNHWTDPGPMVEQQAPAREMVQLRTVINNFNARPGQFKTKGDDRKSDNRGLEI